MSRFSTVISTLALAVNCTLPLTPAHALPMEGNTPNVLSFGVGNNPLGGPSRLAGMPVGYRYQYFTGGLGGNDWRYWNSPDGAFADLWLAESRDAGLTPVVTYYNIVPAAPYAYEDPPFRNLQVSATMKAYFENWIFLLQRIAAFGDPVVVHLEPDLFGYFQWNNNDPAQTAVSVASSGLPQASGYENNARGFAQLMVALRDQYAPNVVLGWHASAWATRTDLILNQGDPDVLGLATADFYRSLGASFDVMFGEFSDRDSGYYQAMGQPQRWWQAADFDRYRQFVSRLSTELSQDVVLWQIPVGNTLYRSMNNTTGHYQDNRAEYFLKPVVDAGDTTRLAQYRDAGVVAFLFGAGQDEQTKYYDARGDGITNPAAIDNRQYNHTTHLNDLAALNADDDGGFLRLGIGTYYTNGALPLGEVGAPTLSLQPSSVQCLAGGSATLSARFSAAVAADTPVSLTSASPAVATVPASVVVSAGSSTSSFPINCISAGSVSILAQGDGLNASALVTVTAPPPPVTVNLTPDTGACRVGRKLSMKVALSTTATQTTTVALVSNSPAVTVPSGVTVKAGAAAASFSASCAAVGSATVQATLGSQVDSSTVTVSR